MKLLSGFCFHFNYIIQSLYHPLLTTSRQLLILLQEFWLVSKTHKAHSSLKIFNSVWELCSVLGNGWCYRNLLIRDIPFVMHTWNKSTTAYVKYVLNREISASIHRIIGYGTFGTRPDFEIFYILTTSNKTTLTYHKYD